LLYNATTGRSDEVFWIEFPQFGEHLFDRTQFENLAMVQHQRTVSDVPHHRKIM
jgi:hypothetical protein